VIAGDTPTGLPISNFQNNGLIDTLYSSTQYAEVYAQGNALRYAFYYSPTRYHQVAMPLSDGDTLRDSTKSKSYPNTSYVPLTANSFSDSMMVQFKGTTFDDSLFLIVKKYTNGFLIKRKYSAYTFSSDSCMTPEFGTKLFAQSSKSLFGEDVKAFRSENFVVSTPCTLHVNPGTSAR
jgi:hypothetical protein